MRGQYKFEGSKNICDCFVHEETVTILREVVLETVFLGFPQFGREGEDPKEEEPDDEVGVDVPFGEEAVEDEGEHVHEFGNEAEHAEGEVAYGGGEKFDAVDSQEGVAEAHDDPHEDVQQQDDGLAQPLVLVMGLDEVEEDMRDARHHQQLLDDDHSAEVDASENGGHVGNDFDEACKRDVEGVGGGGVELTLRADEVAETDQRPDRAYDDHPDADGVVPKERGVGVVHLPRGDRPPLQHLLVAVHLRLILQLLLEKEFAQHSLIGHGNVFDDHPSLLVTMLGDLEPRRVQNVLVGQVEQHCEGDEGEQEDDSPVDKEERENADCNLPQCPADRAYHGGHCSHHLPSDLCNREEGCVIEAPETGVEEEHPEGEEPRTACEKAEEQASNHHAEGLQDCPSSALALYDFPVVEATNKPSVEEGGEAGAQIFFPLTDQTEAVGYAPHVFAEAIVPPRADCLF